jgi:hypothetical protein
MKTSKTYIIAWNGAIDNCLDISKQLFDGDLPHLFYNVSDKENQTVNWQTAKDVRYHSHFFNAVKDFLSTDHEIFVFNSGDIAYDNYASYTRQVEALFNENINLALFAPNATNNPYSGWGSLIEQSKKYPHLYLSTNTDGLWTFMSREIAQYMADFYAWSIRTGEVDFSSMTSGWGLDSAYCSLAICLNKVIYRDNSVTVFHPTGQSYIQDNAIIEFRQTASAFLKFAEDVLGLSPDRLRSIVNQTLGKIKTMNMEPLLKQNIYTDFEAVRYA